MDHITNRVILRGTLVSLPEFSHENHGKQFYALLEKYMPDYKTREKMLKNTEFSTEK